MPAKSRCAPRTDRIDSPFQPATSPRFRPATQPRQSPVLRLAHPDADMPLKSQRDRSRKSRGGRKRDEITFSRVAPPVSVFNLIYHLYPRKDSELWLDNLEQLLHRWDTFNGKRVIAVATDRRSETLETVQYVFNKRDVQWLEVSQNDELQGTMSFRQLLDAVSSPRADEATFYAHYSGDPEAQSPGGIRQRNALYHHLLDNLHTVRDALWHHPCAGGCKVVWPEQSHLNEEEQLRWGNYIFSGSFFWFRNDAVFGHPGWQEVSHTSNGVSSWLASLFDVSRAVSVFQPWPSDSEVIPEVYDPENYGGDFDDPEDDDWDDGDDLDED